MSLTEILAAFGLILLLGGGMLLGVLDQRRRARDTQRVSQARQAQAALEAYRARNASYPGSSLDLAEADAALADALGYQAEPQGCGSDAFDLCQSYTISFSLEGPIGSLNGTKCAAHPQGLSCSR